MPFLKCFAFVDFKKALDSVHHDKLLHAMQNKEYKGGGGGVKNLLL